MTVNAIQSWENASELGTETELDKDTLGQLIADLYVMTNDEIRKIVSTQNKIISNFRTDSFNRLANRQPAPKHSTSVKNAMLIQSVAIEFLNHRKDEDDFDPYEFYDATPPKLAKTGNNSDCAL